MSTVTEGQPAELPIQPVAFIPVNDYTTYRAELAIKDGNLVFHFYVTNEIQRLPNPQTYWRKLFPDVLSVVASNYFQVTYPRLRAAYEDTQASWWMEAQGFGRVLDPHRFAYKFFDELDAALDGEMAKAT